MNRPNKIFAVVLSALLVLLAFDFILLSESESATRRAPVRRPATPQIFASGNGTQRSPHIIRTAAQLSAFAASVNNGETYDGRFIRLGANIDLRNVHWTPIGFYDAVGGTRPFKGSFDGAGFTIFNMGAGNEARRPASAFFGALDGATINRACLQFVNVAGESNVGGLVGFMTGSTLKNSSVSGSVRGQYAIGGIVGSALSGFLENCYFSGSVTGESGVGGLAGAVDRVAMRFCKVSGHVDGNIDVGGFVGGILDGMIIDGVADTVVVNGERNVGGFAGNMIEGGRIEGVTFNGQVRGNARVGGIVGRMTTGAIVRGSVTGSVRGRAHTGGIIGEFIDGEIRRCVTTASVDGIIDIGGIAGRMLAGIMRDNVNHGMINGGEAVGGLVGNFASTEALGFALANNRNTGHVGGHFSSGPLVGAGTQ